MNANERSNQMIRREKCIWLILKWQPLEPIVCSTWRMAHERLYFGACYY